MHDHLDPSIVEQLQWPLQARIDSCLSDRIVEYPHIELLVEELDKTVSDRKNRRSHSVLLVGEGNSGKSTVLDIFRSRHEPRVAQDGTVESCLAYVRMPGKPDESSLWTEILHAFRIVHPVRHTAKLKRPIVERTLKNCNCIGLVIDEFNHVNNAGKDAAPLLASIKNLVDATGINIAAAGTAESRNALKIDPQLSGRFKDVYMPKWELDATYLGFLAGYERVLPLAEPSLLYGQDLALEIHRLAGSREIGRTVEVITELAAFSLAQGSERITADLLKAWEAREEQLKGGS